MCQDYHFNQAFAHSSCLRPVKCLFTKEINQEVACCFTERFTKGFLLLIWPVTVYHVTLKLEVTLDHCSSNPF